MADLPSSFRLNSGTNVPAVGLGTFQADGGDAKRAVKLALQLGYRHIDCANGYGNEKEVGEALRESGIPRKELFITSKLYISPYCIINALEAN
jgi:diketogulonate reductase-like aldo/keto reductase